MDNEEMGESSIQSEENEIKSQNHEGEDYSKDSITNSCEGNTNNDRIKLLLDLDSTLICSEIIEELDTSKKNVNKMGKFKFHNMDDYYLVFERPHLQKILSYVFENFDVSVWTAASKDYALFIINNILLRKSSSSSNSRKTRAKYGKLELKDSDSSSSTNSDSKSPRKLQCVFYSYHCDISEKIKKGHKALSLLWDIIPGYTENNTLIIDDLEDVSENQECNTINLKPFLYTDKDSDKDTELLNVMNQLKSIKKEWERTGKINTCKDKGQNRNEK